MANQAHFDLVILGSGSAAFAAALRAQEFRQDFRHDGGARYRRDVCQSRLPAIQESNRGSEIARRCPQPPLSGAVALSAGVRLSRAHRTER